MMLGLESKRAVQRFPIGIQVQRRNWVLFNTGVDR